MFVVTTTLQRLIRKTRTRVRTMAIDDICDDRIFVVSAPDSRSMDAVGIRLNKDSDTLVGIYSCWNEFQNPSALITDIVKTFGKVQLYGNECFDKSMALSVVCMFDAYMAVGNRVYPAATWELPTTDDRYGQLKMDLTEIKASKPKVYLHLDYDRESALWKAKPLADIVLRGEGYDVPLPEHRKMA